MIYVLDTGCFRKMENYYPDVFPTFWAQLQDAVDEGTIVSVREVWREIEQSNAESHVNSWAKDNKKALFRTPEPEEAALVGRIFAVPHFRQLIGQKQLLRGSPVADPFLIAAAMYHGGTVVTTEKFAPNSAKIPNVCKHFNVPCMDLQGLFRARGWSF